MRMTKREFARAQAILDRMSPEERAEIRRKAGRYGGSVEDYALFALPVIAVPVIAVPAPPTPIVSPGPAAGESATGAALRERLQGCEAFRWFEAIHDAGGETLTDRHIEQMDRQVAHDGGTLEEAFEHMRRFIESVSRMGPQARAGAVDWVVSLLDGRKRPTPTKH